MQLLQVCASQSGTVPLTTNLRSHSTHHAHHMQNGRIQHLAPTPGQGCQGERAGAWKCKKEALIPRQQVESSAPPLATTVTAPLAWSCSHTSHPGPRMSTVHFVPKYRRPACHLPFLLHHHHLFLLIFSQLSKNKHITIVTLLPKAENEGQCH